MNNTVLTQLSNVLIQDQDNADYDKVSFRVKDVPLGKLPRAEKPKMKCSLIQQLKVCEKESIGSVQGLMDRPSSTILYPQSQSRNGHTICSQNDQSLIEN